MDKNTDINNKNETPTNLEFSDVNNVSIEMSDVHQNGSRAYNYVIPSNSIATPDTASDIMFLKFRYFIQWRNHVRESKQQSIPYIEKHNNYYSDYVN